MHGAELLQRAKQHADGIVEINGVDGQPLAEILAHRQPHSLSNVAAAKCCLNVSLEGEALQCIRWQNRPPCV